VFSRIRRRVHDSNQAEQRQANMISVPLRKFYTEQMFVVAHEAHATAQQCRHTNSEAFPALKGLFDIYTPY